MRNFFSDFFNKGDMFLLGLCVTASMFSLILVYTATNWMDNDRYLQVQLAATLLGIVIYTVLSVMDFRSILEKCWTLILGFNIGFLLLLETSWGTSKGMGNRNWLELPGFPVDIQPNEVIKTTYILLMAHFISKIQEDKRKLGSPSSLLQLGSHAALTLGLIAVICGDWGMVVIYACITLVMLWCAGLNAAWFVAGFGSISCVIHILWKYFLPYSDYWTDHYLIMRFRVILDRNLDPLYYGWHQTQSIRALGSGKFFGQGYLQGIITQSPVSQSLPERHTDFIFTVCGEELGFIGCALLLSILFAIILRCVWIAHHVDSFFAAYVAMGSAGMLLAQVFFNIGMCLYIMPTMGLTLPFISYGGSSVVTMYASMGIVSSLRARALPSWIRDRGQLMF